jgi:hypothetical protein
MTSEILDLIRNIAGVDETYLTHAQRHILHQLVQEWRTAARTILNTMETSNDRT